MTFDLIGVQFDGMGRAGGQARAPQVLRRHGLEAAFVIHETLADADFVPPASVDARRGHLGFINEAALLQTIAAVRQRVLRSLEGGRFPIIYGGDCAVLLGAIPALQAAEPGAGLLSVDAHEDASSIEEAAGEAANMEIGLLLEINDVSAQSLGLAGPAQPARTVALLGVRDEPFRRARHDIATVAEHVWLMTAADVVAAPSAAGSEAVQHIRSRTDDWWLHVDLDVLSFAEFDACGDEGHDPLPGGLTWAQLTTVTTAALDGGGCRGCSVVVYNPDRDSDRGNAARIVDFLRAIAPHLPPAGRSARLD